MKHLTLRQLRAFEAVAHFGSFTAAAQALRVTQPTLSMQIKRLTDMAGTPLFEQIGKRIFLTEGGRELITTSRAIFADLTRFEMTIANLKGIKQGNLSIAAVTTTEYFAPRLLGVFLQRYPGITVSLKLLNREALLDRLKDNLDDFYILGQPPHDDDVEAIVFVENPLEIIASTNHVLAKKTCIPLVRIAEENFILRERGSGTRMALERTLKNNEVKITSSMELGSNEAIKQAVLGGLGIAVLSRYSLINEMAAGKLVTLPVSGFPLMGNWYIVYPKGKQLSILAKTLYEFLLDEGKELLASSY